MSTGHHLSATCAALVNSGRTNRLLAWTDDTYNPQTHAAAIAWEILQVLSPKPDARSREHPHTSSCTMLFIC